MPLVIICIHQNSPAAVESTKENKLVVVNNRHISEPAGGCHRRGTEGIASSSAATSGGIIPTISRRPRRLLDARPPLGLDVEAPQIVQPGRTVVAAEEVDAGGVADDDAVVLPASRLLAGEDLHLLPLVCVEPVRVKVIEPTGPAAVALRFCVGWDRDKNQSAGGASTKTNLGHFQRITKHTQNVHESKPDTDMSSRQNVGGASTKTNLGHFQRITKHIRRMCTPACGTTNENSPQTCRASP